MPRRPGPISHIKTNLQKESRRGFRILAMLVLVFTLIGASPSRVAQATPVIGRIRFDMNVKPSKMVVCVNESIPIRVSVHRIASSRPGSGTNDRRVSGVGIKATSADMSMGTITPNRLVVGDFYSEPGVAEFTFKAGENPGTAYLYFEGTVNNYWYFPTDVLLNAGGYHVARPLQLEVKKCTYKINVMFQEEFPNVMAWTGWADPIRLTADSPTQFSGTTAFFYSQRLLLQMPTCNLSISVMPTTINYQADLVGDWLNFSITIQNTTNTVTAPCVGAMGMGELGTRMIDDSVPEGGGVVTHQDPPYGVFTIYVVKLNE